jgi:hypothetical protein
MPALSGVTTTCCLGWLSWVGVCPMGWQTEFDEPIPLPKGQAARNTARRCKLHHQVPKAKHAAEEWQAAMQALLLVAEQNGLFARIGVMNAFIGTPSANSIRSVRSRTGEN